MIWIDHVDTDSPTFAPGYRVRCDVCRFQSEWEDRPERVAATAMEHARRCSSGARQYPWGFPIQELLG